jgi:hypothetical protein
MIDNPDWLFRQTTFWQWVYTLDETKIALAPKYSDMWPF